MDFRNYPNIANLKSQLGKEKRSAFNKKKYDKSEQAWNSFTYEELAIMNQEASCAVRVLDCFVTPNYLFVLDTAVFSVIPVRNMIWMYSSTFTQRMYFIPYLKIHNLMLVDRFGKSHGLGTKNTVGFSRKTPCSDALSQIINIVGPQRKGLLVGWTQQILDAVANNLPALVEHVDANSI